MPVVIHPPPVGYGEEVMNDYRLASSVGRPQDNCLALARLIVRGIFEQFPTLKLVVTHLGGGICEVIGRMNYAYTLQEEAFFLGSYEPMLIKHPPLHYLKMCYLDSVCYHLPAARCVVETVGADKVVFGTDAPPLTPIKGDGIQMIRDLKLAPADEAKVFSGNAKKLLKIAYCRSSAATAVCSSPRSYGERVGVRGNRDARCFATPPHPTRFARRPLPASGAR